MNFFDHQDAARRNTNRLVLLYVLSIISIILSVYGAVLVTASLFGYKATRVQRLERSAVSTDIVAFEREIDRLQPPSPKEDSKVELVGFRSRAFRSGRSTRSYRSGDRDYSSPNSNTNRYPSRFSGEDDRRRYPSRYSPYDDRYNFRPHNAIPRTAVVPRRLGLWEPELFFLSTTGAILVIGAGSWFRFSSLKAGGAVIAEEMGGRLILPEIAKSNEELQLLNIVEEIAIASGVPLPLVYVLDGEPGMNAFAAGYTVDDAVIGVTRGSLDNLTRDEMQGVIGHEFSHILNGDMKLNLQLIAALHGIMMIYVAGRLFMPSAYDRWRLDAPTVFGS